MKGIRPLDRHNQSEQSACSLDILGLLGLCFGGGLVYTIQGF
jgi:hypothetical protein